MARLSDQDLQEELRHIYYELWMLFSTGSYILDAMEEEDSDDQAPSDGEEIRGYSAFTHTSPPPQVTIWEVPQSVDIVAHNSKVESFAIHTRALLEVFFPESYKPHDTDFLATHFFSSTKDWVRIRGIEWNEELADIRNRVGREIAHITSFRKAYPVKEKAWPVRRIVREIAGISERFLAAIPSDLEPDDWSLEQEIRQILEAD